METKKKYFMDCHLAGLQYHDADEIWDKLKVGTVLNLERDLDNRHDKDAVAVVYHNEETTRIIQSDISLATTMIRLPRYWKWDGRTSSSAASARLIPMHIRSIRFI